MIKYYPRHLVSGKTAESIAEQYLRSKGLKLVEKNFTAKSGEIDLIMRDGNQLVFTEVRYRQNTRFGLPEETVILNKQRKIVKTAQQYLIQKRIYDECECRFDIVAIHGTIPQHKINWIKDAFYAPT